MTEEIVGIVGLGAIGSAMAKRLIGQGASVCGYDIAAPARSELVALGGNAADDAAMLAVRCRTIVFALPDVAALASAVDAVAGVDRGGLVVDIGTFAVTDKERARARLHAHGWRMLDCTISGNHDLVVAGDYALFASGAPDVIAGARPLLASLSNNVNEVGAFGSASTVKLILNHLVMVHTAAAAEAMALAERVGLDRAAVYELVTRSAATSRLFDIRGKMMVDGDYTSSRGNYHAILKDARIIKALADQVGYDTPLFDTAAQMHQLGVEQGFGEQDTASIVEALQKASANRARRS